MEEANNIDNKIKIIPNQEESLIAGKNLKFYWQAVRWFILLLVVLEAINIIFDIYKYGHWIIEVIIFLFFNFWLMRIRRIEFATSMTASIFLGLGAGLLLAIFEIIWYHQIVYLLNLIRQPVIVTVVGLVVGFIFYLLFKSLLSKKDKNNLKGGGIYGRKTNVNDRFR